MAAVFARLDSEERIQIGDKTRLDASKCFVAPVNATAITGITIYPGDDSAGESVFNADDSELRYLDWVFTDFKFDVVEGYNDLVDIEQGGSVYTGELTPGTYTLQDFLDHICTQLGATSGVGGAFTATVSKDKVTIVNSIGTKTKYLHNGPNADRCPFAMLGFRPTVGNAMEGASVTGRRIEYCERVITVSCTNGSMAEVTKVMRVFSVAGDALFSSDGDLQTWEPDVMKYVKGGRSSWLNVHREAQDQILYFLDKNGYVNTYGQKYDKFDIIDVSEVNEWSAFTALSIIMWSISNKTDDIFLKKHFEFKKKADEARQRAVLRLDTNEDGVEDVGEQVDIAFGTVVTR